MISGISEMRLSLLLFGTDLLGVFSIIYTATARGDRHAERSSLILNFHVRNNSLPCPTDLSRWGTDTVVVLKESSRR